MISNAKKSLAKLINAIAIGWDLCYNTGRFFERQQANQKANERTKEMTSNEMIKAYKAAKKYGSLRSKAANFKIQDFCGGTWRTLFCVEHEIEARGYVTMRRGQLRRNTVLRIVSRDGKTI